PAQVPATYLENGLIRFLFYSSRPGRDPLTMPPGSTPARREDSLTPALPSTPAHPSSVRFSLVCGSSFPWNAFDGNPRTDIPEKQGKARSPGAGLRDLFSDVFFGSVPLPARIRHRNTRLFQGSPPPFPHEVHPDASSSSGSLRDRRDTARGVFPIVR